MAHYGGIPKEETLKGLVRDDYFSAFGYEPNIDNIDFVITGKRAGDDLFSESPGSSRHYLWAEAKKGSHDVFDMFTQLLLTCKKTYDKADHLAPPWLGCFDESRIAFVSFHDMLPIFSVTDFNWNTTPSNHETDDFRKAREKVKNLIGAKIVIYHFDSDDRDIKEFIKTHFTADGGDSIKSPITKDNFVQIFIKWIKEVKPSINVSKDEWVEFKGKGILDCDFYRADMMSSDGNTITEKLKIVLKNDNYKFQEHIGGRLFLSDIGFTDNGAAYSRFWNKYERPPAAEYQQYIIDRRDLLVPQNIREVKGSFFTPKIWADKSKEYLEQVFGKNWQEEYYVWDCAAGTGNLLAGLINQYNIWASDIEQGNVETMQSLIEIDDNLNLLPAHVFQFDFLNDSFDKLPEELKKIINDEEKRKKLIVYINPPYAEATSAATVMGTRKNKAEVSTKHSMNAKYKEILGKAANELFSLFIMRVADELRGAYLAMFSKLKYVNSSNFTAFRVHFSAKFQKGFICRADTFDNVDGKFPIGFLIWRLSYNGYDFRFPKTVKLDVLNDEGKRISKKGFYNGRASINQWIKDFDSVTTPAVGYMANPAPDFLATNQPYITVTPGTRHFNYFAFKEKNLIEGCIYFAVRLCIEANWINDRDQFLYPNKDDYKKDKTFQHDCLIFALFHGQNRVSCADGVNHWIPFTENEVDSKEKFASDFMSTFIKGKKFSAEAKAVLKSGKALWKYYHAKIINNKTASVNASFYDIREFFQGRNEKGTMKTTSEDEEYNTLIKDVRANLALLAGNIKPKVYEYGFLKE